MNKLTRIMLWTFIIYLPKNMVFEKMCKIFANKLTVNTHYLSFCSSMGGGDIYMYNTAGLNIWPCMHQLIINTGQRVSPTWPSNFLSLHWKQQSLLYILINSHSSSSASSSTSMITHATWASQMRSTHFSTPALAATTCSSIQASCMQCIDSLGATTGVEVLSYSYVIPGFP